MRVYFSRYNLDLHWPSFADLPYRTLLNLIVYIFYTTVEHARLCELFHTLLRNTILSS